MSNTSGLLLDGMAKKRAMGDWKGAHGIQKVEGSIPFVSTTEQHWNHAVFGAFLFVKPVI